MVIGPAWRHPRGLALLALAALMPAVVFVVGSILTYQLGVDSLRAPLESINGWLATRRFMDLVMVLSPIVALLLAIAPLVRLDLRANGSGREAVIGLRIRLANVIVGSMALVIGGLLLWYIVFESAMEAGL